MDKKAIVVIVGPTASGKSDLGVTLAKRFHGEIISADSRQVYQGMNIGTGKISTKDMQGIPHHLLDIVSPKKQCTVAQYHYLAKKAIAEITRQGKIPFLVGGSPLYIYSLVDGWVIPEVKPNWKLRKKLERFTAEQLFQKLQSLDRSRSETIESKNKRRLVRALEIVMSTKKPVAPLKKHPLPYPVLFLGIKKSPEILTQLIHKRILKRMRAGMVQEVQNLKDSGLSWKRLEEFGLEYRYIAWYLQKKLSKKEMIEKLQKSIEDFARRQMTWFKKDKRIHWIENTREAEPITHQFLIAD